LARRFLHSDFAWRAGATHAFRASANPCAACVIERPCA
jgi:hypothetical protein